MLSALRHTIRCGACVALLASALCEAPLQAQSPASPQTAAPAAATRPWRWSLANTTRVEAWTFFEPPRAGGDPDYAFVGNRLRLGLTWTWPRVEVAGTLQYVQFGGLPDRSIGPGPLGTGALYYEHSGETDSHGVYVRALNVRAWLPRGIVLQAGRFGYASGAESASGRPKIEAVKRARLDSRMIGEFEWSLYQRTFDGVRADIDRARWHVTGAWLRPTQGGFEEDAGASLRDVDVEAATLTLRPGVVLPSTDVAVFVYRYDDGRPVTVRPDNTGRGAAEADVGIATFGATGVGAAPAGAGEFDWLVWFAGQRGSWYEQSHRGWAAALEAGYQWQAPWQPWLRAGYAHASGDGTPADDRHSTFFPMLPTVRKYAFTTAYAPMNLRETFAELIVRPTPRVTARADIRRLHLAEGADRWYGGSGATRRQGAYFGYAGRASGGHTDLGTAVQAAADVRLNSRWSVNAFSGTIRGGPVVRNLFTGRWLHFWYIENVIQF